MKRNRYWQVVWLWMLSLQGLSCADEGTYQLHLLFPDDLARQSISEVALGALNPQGHTCNELIQGQVTVSQLTAYTNQTFAYPPEQPIKLPMVPSGTLLFFAEGRKGISVMLRGCSQVEVKAGAKVEVALSLVWVCHPNPNGEVPGNGIDDDCDGQTDETQICDPGDSKACTCTNGRGGAQVCSQDGTRWEECKCQEDEFEGGAENGDGGGQDDGYEAEIDAGGDDDGHEAEVDAGGDELPDGGEAEPDEGLVIDFFTANPQEFIVGQSVALSWSTQNATACTLNGSQVSLSSQGDFVLEQPCPWTYRLDCQGPGQTASKSVTLSYICSDAPAPLSGTLDIKSQNDLAAFVPPGACYKIQGSLAVRFNNDIVSLTPLYGLVEMTGQLKLYGNEVLVQLDGLCLVKTIGSSVSIGTWYDPANDPSPPDPIMPDGHYGNPSLQSLAGLSQLDQINGLLVIEENDVLLDLNGLDGVTRVDNELLIQYNPSLQSLTALANLTSVGTDSSDYLWLEGLPNLSSLAGLENLQNLIGFLGVVNTNVDTLASISNIKTQVPFMLVRNNPMLSALTGLEWVSSMTRSEGYVCPGDGGNICEGTLAIESNERLVHVNALSNLTHLDESLLISGNPSLLSIEGLAQLQFVGGDITIASNDKLTSLSPLVGLVYLGEGTQDTRGISIHDNSTLLTLWNYIPQSSTFTCAEIFNNAILSTPAINTFVSALQALNSDIVVSTTSDLAGCP